MSVKEAIKAINEGQLDTMKTEFNKALMEKAITKLEEKKIEVAKNYLGAK